MRLMVMMMMVLIDDRHDNGGDDSHNDGDECQHCSAVMCLCDLSFGRFLFKTL